MKKCRKKVKMISVLLAVMFTAESFMPVMKAEGAAMSFPTQIKGQYKPAENTKGKTTQYGYVIQNFPKNGVVKNLKSGNQRVVKVSWKKDKKQYIWLQYKKAGKTTISFDVVDGKKKKHFKTQVIITNYQNPCKSFKIGNKDYASKFKGGSFCNASFKGTKKYKISLKAKDGWKLQKITVYDNRTGKSKQIKNNSTITCKNPYYSITGNFQNKKTKEFQSVSVGLSRQ